MSGSLRDQLLDSGIARQAPKAKQRQGSGNRKRKRKSQRTTGSDMKLADAWALRERAESAEREQARQTAQAERKRRQERDQRLDKLLAGRACNRDHAELPRYFEYRGRIRRILVDATQLEALNAGCLGVVRHGRSYQLLDAALVRQIGEFAPENVALLITSEQVDSAATNSN